MKKEIEINNYSWSHITGNQYFDMLDIINDPDKDEITKQAELVAIVEGCTADDVLNLSMTEAATKFNKLIFLNKFELLKKYNPKKIVISGNEYTVIDTKSMNVAQYIDYQNYISMQFRDSYDKILSLFLVPIDHKYNEGYDVLDVQRAIRTELSWQEVQSLLNFILREFVSSLMHSRKYLVRKMRWIPKTMKEEMKVQIETLDNSLRDLIYFLGTL